MAPDIIRLHHSLSYNRVNGPGSRFVIWTQGCHFNCPGCFNPETFSPSAGYPMDVDQLANDILSQRNSIEGITLSGGEPLLQHRQIQALLSQIHASSDLGVILFTGYTWGELQQLAGIDLLLNEIDLLIAGRYLQTHRQGHHLVGSTNKTFHFLTPRYQPTDLDIPPAEVMIAPDGTINLSGIDPLQW